MVCLLQEAVEAAKLCVGELDKHPIACSHALIEQLTSASASAREFYGTASSTIRCCDGVLAALEHINKGPATTTCCCMQPLQLLLLSHWCWQLRDLWECSLRCSPTATECTHYFTE